MTFGNKYRILLCSIFVLLYFFAGSKSFLSSSARSGLLDSYFFISASPNDLRNYEKADYHTALAVWSFYGFKLLSLDLDEFSRIEYEEADREKYLINEKIVCVSNDETCRENYLFVEALNDQDYKKVLYFLVKRDLSWCEDRFSICVFLKSSIGRVGFLPNSDVIRPNTHLYKMNKDEPVSYLPFARYHFKGLKKGERLCHKNFNNVNHTPFVHSIKSEDKTLVLGEEYIGNYNGINGCYEILFNEDIGAFDIVFVKFSYGRGFPHTSAYGTLDRVEKML
jgi:hypothetical protein